MGEHVAEDDKDARDMEGCALVVGALVGPETVELADALPWALPVGSAVTTVMEEREGRREVKAVPVGQMDADRRRESVAAALAEGMGEGETEGELDCVPWAERVPEKVTEYVRPEGVAEAVSRTACEAEPGAEVVAVAQGVGETVPDCVLSKEPLGEAETRAVPVMGCEGVAF